MKTAFGSFKNNQGAESAHNKGKHEKLRATSQSMQYKHQKQKKKITK